MSCAAALLTVGAVLASARPAAPATLEGWPCEGCTTVLPWSDDAGADTASHPLLVALHGDGGATRPLVRAWQAAAREASAILLVPKCPKELGCTSASFWKWLDTSRHDPAWLGVQIDAVSARFLVEPRKVVATGYSGGATYLGYYVPAFPTRFAAVAHVAGGAAYRPPCPRCKVPVSFLIGATDPMIVPYTRPLHDWYEACGEHELVWQTLPGVTHESILSVLPQGHATRLLAWMLTPRKGCDEPIDAGAGAAVGAAFGIDAGPPNAAPTMTPKGAPQPGPPPVQARCACGVAPMASAPAAFEALLLIILVARARRGRALRARSRLS